MHRSVRTFSTFPRAIVLALAISACATGGSDLAARLADTARSAEDRDRDASRRPAEVVAFLGIEPGMRVMDLIAAGGYYTEVLSLAVGPEGRVYAQNNDFVLKLRNGVNEKALSARLAGGRLPNVERVDAEIASLPLPDRSLDAAITALNFHDVYNGRGEEAAVAFLEAVHAKLKPGGILGIVDHVGIAGEDNRKLHRIERQQVLEVVAQSSFVVSGESDVLANAGDDHTENVFAPGRRGATDRFVLRLKRP